MRVTLNYGIQFEEIPDFLQKRIELCGELKDKIDALLTVASYQLSTEDYEALQKCIHNIRLNLSEIDNVLGDVAEMSTGYANAKDELKKAAQVKKAAESYQKQHAQSPEPQQVTRNSPEVESKIRTFDHLKSKPKDTDPKDCESEDLEDYSDSLSDDLIEPLQGDNDQ